MEVAELVVTSVVAGELVVVPEPVVADALVAVVGDGEADLLSGELDAAAVLVVGAEFWLPVEQPARPATTTTHPTVTLRLRFMAAETTGRRDGGVRRLTRRCG